MAKKSIKIFFYFIFEKTFFCQVAKFRHQKKKKHWCLAPIAGFAPCLPANVHSSTYLIIYLFSSTCSPTHLRVFIFNFVM